MKDPNKTAKTPPQFPFELNRMWKEIGEIYHRVALKNNLSDAALDVLYTVYTHRDNCSQKLICEESFLSKQTVNSAVQKLVKEGTLEKQGTGKTQTIMLTATGLEKTKQIIQPILEGEESALKELSREDIATFNRITETFIAALHRNLPTAN